MFPGRMFQSDSNQIPLNPYFAPQAVPGCRHSITCPKTPARGLCERKRRELESLGVFILHPGAILWQKGYVCGVIVSTTSTGLTLRRSFGCLTIWIGSIPRLYLHSCTLHGDRSRTGKPGVGIPAPKLPGLSGSRGLTLSSCAHRARLRCSRGGGSASTIHNRECTGQSLRGCFA